MTWSDADDSRVNDVLELHPLANIDHNCTIQNALCKGMMMLRLSFLIAILLFFLTMPFAYAVGDPTKERAARKACLSGDYATGVELLADLYIDTKDPTHIFNQARCFEQNNRCNEAIARFREYLRKDKKITLDEKAMTEKHIADCQALLGQNSPSEAANRAPPKSEVAEVKVVPTVAPSPSPSPSPSLKPSDVIRIDGSSASPGRGLRIMGLTCGLIAVASIGTAIYYYTEAKSYSQKVSQQKPPIPNDQKAGQNAETMQWVFYSTGAVALIAGTVLYGLGWNSSGEGLGHARITPMLGSGLAGLAAQGHF